MKLTPTLQAVAIVAASLVQMAGLIWTGIEADLLALDLDTHIYSIVRYTLGVLDAGAFGWLVWFGLSRPKIEPPGE